MARLVLSVGGIVEQELFARREVVRNVGVRIAEFQLSGSAYGQAIPHVFGRARLAANIIWMRGIREKRLVERQEVGGVDHRLIDRHPGADPDVAAACGGEGVEGLELAHGFSRKRIIRVWICRKKPQSAIASRPLIGLSGMEQSAQAE